jgi:universal stress protein A
MKNNSLSYKNILAGVATQVEGHPAVLRAVNVADKSGGQVTLAHAVNTADSADEPKSTLMEFQARHPEIKDFKLAVGRTWAAINEMADEAEADIIIIGSHVHSQLRALLGTTTDQVIHHTSRDVLIVRNDAYTTERAPADYRHVVAAIDLKCVNNNACRKAAKLASEHGADLTMLNVVEHYPVDRENDDIAREDEDPVEHQKKVKGEGLMRIAEEVGRMDAGKEVIISNDAANRAVPDYARANAADLIVIGSREHAGLNVLLGSIPDDIVHHAPCDVLVVQAGK